MLCNKAQNIAFILLPPFAVSACPPERQITPPKPPNSKRPDVRPTPQRPKSSSSHDKASSQQLAIKSSQPVPAAKGSKNGGALPNSSKKKVICPAGNKCFCGEGWECHVCGGCLDGGCVPPCPEALEQIENAMVHQESREKERSQAPPMAPNPEGPKSFPKPASHPPQSLGLTAIVSIFDYY